jgi:hypothetical protein
MSNELAVVTRESLISELEKYTSSYPKAWEKIKSELPEPEKATDQDLEKVNDLRQKGRSRYKILSDQRLEITRQWDDAKKELIAKEALLDEGKPVSILFEAKEYIRKATEARLEEQKRKDAEQAQRLEKERAIAAIPATFEAGIKALILEHQTALMTQMQTSIFMAETVEGIDEVEKSLRKQTVLDPDKYKALANQVVKGMGVSPDNMEVVVKTNSQIKGGLVLAFAQKMLSFQKELLNQVEPRRAAILQGQKSDQEAANKASEAIAKEAEEQSAAIVQEGEKAATVATIEAAMEAEVVSTTKIKTNLVAQPKDMEEWARVIAVCLSEKVVDKEWCDKNLKVFLTSLNKKAKEGTTITGVTYVEAVKV